MNFYKIRAFLFISVTRLLGKILVLEVPPVLSVSAVIEKDGKILFLDHTYIKGYGLPGGMVKPRENIESALEREIKEETGLGVVSKKYFTSTATIYKNIPLLSVTFIVTTSGLEKESSEGKLFWLTPGEALKRMAYPDTGVALKKYIERTI